MWDWFGGAQEQRKVQEPESVPVVLHIYDVSGHSAVLGANKFFRAIGTGAYHAGVEVNGHEYSFGCSDGGYLGSGIFLCDPKGCGAHEYRESEHMGHTKLKRKEVDQVLSELAVEWPGHSYDLLRHNCCHFCDAFSRRLGVGPCPAWLTNLAGVGAMLRSGVRLVARAPRAAAGAVAQAPGAAAGAIVGGAGYVGGAAVGVAGAAGAMFAGGGVEPIEEEDTWPAVGETVEIYSNSRKEWLTGVVDRKDGNMVTVIYSIDDQGVNKTLPADHKDLRAAVGIRPSVHGAVSRSAFDDSVMATNGEELKPLQVQVMEGDAVEVWSNSGQVWCHGYVETIRGNLLCVAYQSPGAEAHDWSRKIMPSQNKFWRKPQRQGNDAAGYNVGDAVEIFSNSKQVWGLGRVTKRGHSTVTVCFQLPGAAPEDWLEKDIKFGDKNIRPANLTDCPQDAHKKSTTCSVADVNFSGVERECYEREFVEAYFAGDPPGGDPGSVLADGRQAANHLSRSGLPRRSLKEIWRVGTNGGMNQVNRSQFFLCCRLVAHCQVRIEDSSSKALLEEGGPRLAEFLQKQCINTVPKRLPDFTSSPQ